MKRLAVIVLIAAVLVALPFLWPRLERRGDYQGWVEANLRYIGAETAGRLSKLAVAQGDVVEADELLFQLDDALAMANLQVAMARLASVRARLALATAPQKRPEEIDILKSTKRQVEVQLVLSRQELERVRALNETGTATPAQLDRAIAEEAADRATLDTIEGRIDLAGLPARKETIKAAQAAVSATRAELASARETLKRRSVKAPQGGMVQTLYYRAGEIVPRGKPVVSLLVPNDLRVRFFVPETRIAGLKVGAAVTIQCDGCASMGAVIDFISKSAEYTPPEIYSLEERAKLVYRVEAIPDRPEQLRPGLPVDVYPAKARSHADGP
ncbi:MAG: HlyD family efflux transporter periplasmic adaptor subunit [Hyphomicrobiales bacterium]